MWKWSVPPMNKKVHGCEQVQFTGIFQSITKYYNSFIIIEPRQERKGSWRFLVQTPKPSRIGDNRLLDSNYFYK